MAAEIVHELEWRDIPGWPGYRVSKTGVVQSCKIRNGRGYKSTWQTLKQADDTRGYKSLGLKNVTKRTWIQVHVLVLMAWVSPRPDGMHGCHNDGDRHNNNLENLRWDTPKANAHDAIKHGTWIHGEKYPGAVLTDKNVERMYRLLMEGFSVKQVAEILGAKKGTLHNVISGVAWKHVPRPDGFDKFWSSAKQRADAALCKPRIERTCDACGAQFCCTEKRLNARPAKYCSRRCYYVSKSTVTRL